ncbi:MAG: glycine cleavage system protein H, partial [Verrucomicrobiota bacterium]
SIDPTQLEKLKDVAFNREQFKTRLPGDRLYTASHYWLKPDEGAWRIGLTKFATRMLGEMVEYDFEVKTGEAIATGQIVGWLEGFKATSDLYSVMDGAFLSSNPDLEEKIGLVHADPYRRGWLYRAEGAPEPESADVNGYAAILNQTIDRILEQEM